MDKVTSSCTRVSSYKLYIPRLVGCSTKQHLAILSLVTVS